jgi:hypothetical protein
MPLNPETATFLRNFLANNLKGEHAITLAAMNQLDDAAMILRLADGLPTVATQLHHAFSSGPWFLSVIARRHADWAEHPLVPFEGSAASLLEVCRRLSDETMKLAKAASVEDLVAEVQFNNESFPAVYMIDWHIVYLVHYRAMAMSTLLQHGLMPAAPYGRGHLL